MAYNITITHIPSKQRWHVKQYKMLNDNEKEGVQRCFNKLDPTALSTDIFLLAGQHDQVQNNIFMFKSAGEVFL